MSSEKPTPRKRGRPKKDRLIAHRSSSDLPVVDMRRVLPRIDRRLEAVGLAESTAGIMAGLSKDTIRNMRRKIETSDREDLSVEIRTLDLLAPVLNTTGWWLGWEIGDEEVTAPGDEDYRPPQPQAQLQQIPVLGRISAGSFLDVSIFPPDVVIETVYAPIENRFFGVRHYGLIVSGDSVDEVYPDGTRVICIDFAEARVPLKSGQMVHVELRSDGGQRYEITLKEVQIGRNGKVTLVPRSRNPAYKPMLLDNLGDDTEVHVRGIVVSGITPARVV